MRRDSGKSFVESRRLEAVQSPVIPIVTELIRNHPGTISLGQGVVGYGPPPQCAEQLQAFSADPENHKYKPVQGIPALLEAVTRKLERENQVRLGNRNALLVTAGGNMGFTNAVLAIADPGDEVILQRPFYFNHEMALVMANCQPVLVDTDERFQLRPDAIARAITPRTRAVVTISPNNPTGAVYSEAALRRVNQLCQEHGIYHIHDEAYETFTYGAARHFSPASIPGTEEHTISLFSLSKAYGFASWRIGYMVLPEHLVVAVKKIQDTILICPPVISQYAAIGALQAGSDYCRERLQEIAVVRELFLNELASIADICTVPETDGAFYFLLRLNLKVDAMELVKRLVSQHGVAAIPGTAFGLSEGCFLRIAYGALKPKDAAEGIHRLVTGLRAVQRPSSFGGSYS
jgi:aspartate/methionine/tyrosine aminotransferase